MLRRLLPLCGFIVLAAGCSSQSPGSTTLVPNLTTSYSDKTYNFSFQYPATWSVKFHRLVAAGASGPQLYIVHLNVPGNAAGMEVTVSGVVSAFPPITNGEVRKDPSGPSSFRYFNKTVSGLPALRVERFYQGKTDQITTIVNGRKRTYAIRVLTGNPPFNDTVLTGYNLVVRTITLPFS